jgi:hypothetical protein
MATSRSFSSDITALSFMCCFNHVNDRATLLFEVAVV